MFRVSSFRFQVLSALLACLVTTALAQSTAAPSTVIPVGRLAERVWAQRRIQKRLDPNRAVAQVVFIGDSITQGWEDVGKDVWTQYYAPRQAFNLGMEDDRIENVLWRLGHGDLDGLLPKVVVLLIGTNNSGTGQKDSPETIAAGVRVLLGLISQKLPQTKVLLVAIFPRGAKAGDTARVNNDQANTLLSRLADNEHIYFLNINEKFLCVDDTPNTALMPDLLRLNANGYAIWAEAMEPLLAKLLGQPSLPTITDTAASAISGTTPATTFPPTPSTPIAMGSRLELFVDDFMIQQMSGSATQVIHRPEPQEVVMVCDAPWEGTTCAYFSLFEDGDRYRMYYRASYDIPPNATYKWGRNMENTAYAESRDGIHWEKPVLGQWEFNGSKQNNLLDVGGPWVTHNFSATLNANPRAARSAKYIAVGGVYGNQLFLFMSSDGLHWKKAGGITASPPFDSQNVVFWDPHAKLYRCYMRLGKPLPPPQVQRYIRTCTSPNLTQWSEPVEIRFPPETPIEELYTNAIQSYPRAPHILVGFPARYLPSQNTSVEPVFMSSRDGLTFRRWPDAVIPRTAPANRDNNRSNYMAWGFFELPGKKNEYSFYATENYAPCTGGSRLRRFTLRLDGFVSVSASDQAGTVLTKPLTFVGKQLVINGVTKPGGSIRAEVVDPQGNPVDGKTLSDCESFTGDSIEHVIRWQNSTDISALAGKPVQMRFVLKNADLYSFRYR